MDAQIHHAVKHLGFAKLNAMQLNAFEAITKNNFVQLIAPTGSGKTAAFLLPLINKIDKTLAQPQVLVLAPTRELILQISSVWKKMNTGINAFTCYGGHRIETELNELQVMPHIIFGTPGRVNDHIAKQSFTVNDVHTFVIDEFDKTLEPKFYEELATLQANLANINSQILISATEMEELPDFVTTQNWHKVSAQQAIQPKSSVFTVLSEQKDKLKALVDLLHFVGNTSSIIFVNHREAAERINDILKLEKIESIFYHGGLSQIERMLALIKFKNHTANILIASDIAARGIDVDNIDNVIHYHLPANQEAFTHRNGRTARQGAKGSVYVLHHAEENLEEYITKEAKQKNIPFIENAIASPKWITLTVNAGKKNKINKIDIVGFLSKQAGLSKNDIGIIDVLDTVSFIAIDKQIWKDVLGAIRGKKIKGKDYIFKVAK
jgi:ATP-dependent RNA helicase DeaD